MPLTPFHWSILIFGLILFDILYIPALVISSAIMDLEPFYYMFLSPSTDGSVHGFFHTYIGATIIGLIVGFILSKARKRLDKLITIVRLDQSKMPELSIYCSSLFAAYSHIFLDSFMHSDLKPFWPFTVDNPFLGLISTGTIYSITGAALLLVMITYFVHILKK